MISMKLLALFLFCIISLQAAQYERTQVSVVTEDLPKITFKKYLHDLSTIQETDSATGEVFKWSDLDEYEKMQCESLATYQGIIARYKHAIVSHRVRYLMGLRPIEDAIHAVNNDTTVLHYVITGRHDADKLISGDEFMDWWSDIKKDVKKKLNNPEFTKLKPKSFIHELIFDLLPLK